MHQVMALALPEVVAFDLSMAAQIFGHEQERDTYRFTVCAPRPGSVPSTTGFAIEATADLAALEHADTVIVPGYAPRTAPPEPVLAALRAAAARGTRIASVCVGAFALAAAGLLDGRAATTHWQHAEEFRARFPTVRLNPDVLYLDTGSILTSAGITAGIDLCLHLYQRDHGAAAAAAVARRMVVATHRPGGQAQFSRRPLADIDDRLVRTCDWAIAEMHRPLTVAHLARHTGTAVRTFTRLFHAEINMTPMQWLTSQRVLEARRLLEATDLTVDDIAHRCGLGSAVTLRTHLARELGTTPSAYRRTWRSPRHADHG
ncbi:GlxA family transcriptional regulator [Pseudonocardia spinosispora]|uniref:GlxA family transcriptional regulator n=1 Tax=Pseudonocardia spinosispora TaxID=103441 RepID=UPI00042841D3|nr:helix-turn-helix domain-containing protein [Pseudonocardia spinosispora]